VVSFQQPYLDPGNHLVAICKFSICYSVTGTDFGRRDVGRTLTGPEYDAANMTIEMCIGNCSTHGFPYAGTEYGSQCCKLVILQLAIC